MGKWVRLWGLITLCYGCLRFLGLYSMYARTGGWGDSQKLAWYLSVTITFIVLGFLTFKLKRLPALALAGVYALFFGYQVVRILSAGFMWLFFSGQIPGIEIIFLTFFHIPLTTLPSYIVYRWGKEGEGEKK